MRKLLLLAILTSALIGCGGGGEKVAIPAGTLKAPAASDIVNNAGDGGIGVKNTK
jgi:hypothetical protein